MSDKENTIKFFQEEKNDFIPVTAYYHFGQQHLDGVLHAQLQIEFYNKFKPNILKVMNDFSFCMPQSMTTNKFDLLDEAINDQTSIQYKEQIKALKIITQQLHNEVVILDTLFNPWFTIKRHILFNDIALMMENYGSKLHKLLSHVTDSLLNYIERSAATGIDGVLYSIPASPEYLNKEYYLEFMKPYDDKIQHALDRTKLIKIIHIHGHGNIYYNEIIQNYKMDCLNWSDKNTNLSLDKAKSKISYALMGGINESKEFNYLPYRELEKEIDDAIDTMKGHKFILSPGCVLTPQCPSERLMHFFKYSKNKIELSLLNNNELVLT